MDWRRVIFFLNVAAILFFAAFMALTFVWPEYIPYLGLSYQGCLLAIMHIISLMLLLAFFQTHLPTAWRVFSIIASFVVLIESTLMLEIWRYLI